MKTHTRYPLETQAVSNRAPQISPTSNRHNQRSRVLRLLLDANGRWVPLPQILDLQISQYGARIFELRGLGFAIENKLATDPKTGKRHSWFRLLKFPPKADPVLLADRREQLATEPRDWYEKKTGKPRAAESTTLPLFAGDG